MDALRGGAVSYERGAPVVIFVAQKQFIDTSTEIKVSSSALGTVSVCSWEMCSGSEAGSYLRLIDVCITEL